MATKATCPTPKLEGVISIDYFLRVLVWSKSSSRWCAPVIRQPIYATKIVTYSCLGVKYAARHQQLPCWLYLGYCVPWTIYDNATQYARLPRAIRNCMGSFPMQVFSLSGVSCVVKAWTHISQYNYLCTCITINVCLWEVRRYSLRLFLCYWGICWWE